jgi:hypothetical protein
VGASASGAPLGSASATAAASDGARWSGEYAAKKAAIEPPDKVKDITWKRDPGDKNVGPGTITIRVVDGAASGEASGALGDQVIAGTYDGKLLRVSAWPKDPAAADAMTGTGVAELGPSGKLSGALRCAGFNAVVVREASFELSPGK